jgi:hypothetical protein
MRRWLRPAERLHLFKKNLACPWTRVQGSPERSGNRPVVGKVFQREGREEPLLQSFIGLAPASASACLEQVEKIPSGAPAAQGDHSTQFLAFFHCFFDDRSALPSLSRLAGLQDRIRETARSPLTLTEPACWIIMHERTDA